MLKIKEGYQPGRRLLSWESDDTQGLTIDERAFFAAAADKTLTGESRLAQLRHLSKGIEVGRLAFDEYLAQRAREKEAAAVPAKRRIGWAAISTVIGGIRWFAPSRPAMEAFSPAH